MNWIMRGEPGHAPSCDEIRRLAAVRLRSLMQKLSDTQPAADELNNLRQIFKSLPLTSGDFSLAMNHLRNVERYLCSDEPGAARYELRLLSGGL